MNIERQYLNLMQNILENGDKRIDRTGIGTRSIFGAMLRHDMSKGELPALTTKRVYWKTAVREMLWFLTGNTNIRPLVLQGVKIWNEWPHAGYVKATGNNISVEEFAEQIAESEEFAEKWGDLGPVYGKQWVNWDTYEETENSGLFRRGVGINQVTQVIEGLKSNPEGRRHIIEGWNVAQIHEMALPPCHKSYQFHVSDGRLNCMLTQRSCDIFLGLPFNLVGQAVLTAMIAQQAGLECGELIWSGGDVHIYLNHLDAVNEQLSRTPGSLGTLAINKAQTINDYAIDDFNVTGYNPMETIKAPVAV